MYLSDYAIRIIKPVILLLAISPWISGCKQSIVGESRTFRLQEGDLLFQDLDCGPLCEAIQRVTTGYNGAKFSHVGIVAKDTADNFVVIEAVSDGVKVTELQTFLDRSFDADNRPKVVVGRLESPFRHLIPSAIKNALDLTGKPYDKAFVINNDAYYCSELIYEIFLQANNNHPVFDLQPMTFKDTAAGDILDIWQEYFGKLGIPVPQGQPGINPGSISRSPALNIIYVYGNPEEW